MKATKTIILISIILFISCSGSKVRINGMKEDLSLEIPTDNYEEIKNETEGVGPDFEINITLKFDNNDLDKLTKQIISSPYFNKPTTNDVNSSYTKLLKDINRRGLWKRNNVGYEFVDYGTESEPVTAFIDTTKRTLEYKFMHL